MRRNKNIKHLVKVLLFLLVFFQSTNVLADTAYKTFTEDGYANYVETQTAYTVSNTIVKFGDELFSQASDLKIDQNGLLYVSDSGNRRIIVGDAEGNLIRTFGEDVLQKPNGLFISEDQKLYVADEIAAKVFVFSLDGKLLKEYGKPSSPLFGKAATFTPEKVVVDSRENLYILSRGNSNGIIQLNAKNDGEFIGYFASNKTRVTALTEFRKAIFTEEQLEKMIKTVPSTATNINIDAKGLIYTVSQGEKNDTLKKFNMAGKNIITTTVFDKFPSSVDIGSLENIFVASKDGFIYEYTSEGNLLFVFGGSDDGRQRVGLFKTISAIALDQNDTIYALDSEKNEIQIFQPTEFTNLVHKALTLYQNGDYEASKEPWQEVLKMNSLFDFANLGMGEAYFKEENYNEALQSYRLAKYHRGYSDSFWEIRNTWMRENIITLFGILLGLYVLKIVISYLNKKYYYSDKIKEKYLSKYKFKLLKEILYVKEFLRHPLDSFYGIKKENKTSFLSANILLLIFFIIFVCNKYLSGFIFRFVEDGVFNIGTDFYTVAGTFLLLIISNYLVSTINDGEGSFKDIYCGIIYSFAPYFIFKPFIILASNVLTYNESFLLNFANVFIYSWVVILIITMIKEINNYTFRETFKNIFLTLFTLLIGLLLIFIIYVLVSQVISFVISIFSEAVYRVEGR
jgi:sugar lactone lactonase YvrE